ncbi:Unconventional myosin-Ig [Geodia barretti]|uniref:Unconventional myosin-Ig n=1 Tax=Geodia barretti TaxID=519541 RepID=A0AA35R2S7_GEOBA|nr:Unconventional myosin-Ig [Geodia barretti]
MKSFVHRIITLFRGVASMPDLGKSIPWPEPPPVLTKFVTYAQQIHARWRAKVILLRIPVRDRPEVQLKAIAYGALSHRREKWGYNRKWFGNYLTLQSENPNVRDFETALTHLRHSHSFDKVLFACLVTKINKRCKQQDRAIVVTDTNIFKLDPRKHFQRKKSPLSLATVEGVSISTSHDQAFIVHFQGGKDLLFYMVTAQNENRVAELVAVLCQICQRKFGKNLQVTVASPLTCRLGGKQKELHFQEDRVAKPYLRKQSNQQMVLFWPSASF